MLKVQSYNALGSNISFQQNKEAQEGQKQPYFKTHAGAKLGTAIFTTAVVAPVSYASYVANTLKKTPELKVIHEAEIKAAVRRLPHLAAVIIGCGALVDMRTNSKRAKFTQNNISKDIKETLKEDKSAKSTEKGNVYHKSSTGRHEGTLLGMIALPALHIGKLVQAKNIRSLTVVAVALNMVKGAAGGFLLGAITDHFANKGARKFADRG